MKFSKVEFLIIVATLTVQLLFLIIFIHFAGEQKIISNDGLEYYTLGKNLLTEGKFSLFTGDGHLMESLRTPLYPLFITLTLFILDKIWFISLLQIILSGFIAVIIYRLSAFFLPGRWLLLPVVLYLSNPYTWFASVLAMTEVLYTVFSLLAVYFLFRYLQNFDWKTLAVSVFLLAASILIRPVSFYLFFGYGLFIATYLTAKFKSYRQTIGCVLIFLSAWLIFVLPWSWRNYELFGRFEISSIQNYNLYFYNARLFYAGVNNLSKDETILTFRNKAKDHFSPRALIVGVSYDDYRRSLLASEYYNHEALGILAPHIFSYARLHLIGMVPFFTDAGWRDLLSALNVDIGQAQSLTLLLTQGKFSAIWENITQTPLYFSIFILGKIYYALILVLILAAFFLVPRRQRFWILIIYFLILYFAVVSSPVANARFRYPVEPLMLITATVAISAMVVRRSAPDPAP